MSIETSSLRSLLEKDEEQLVIQILSQIRGQHRTYLSRRLPDLDKRLRDARKADLAEREEAIKKELLQLIDQLQDQGDYDTVPVVDSKNDLKVVSSATEEPTRTPTMAEHTYNDTIAATATPPTFVMGQKTQAGRETKTGKSSASNGVPAGGTLVLAVVLGVATVIAIGYGASAYLSNGSVPGIMSIGLPLLTICFMAAVMWYLVASVSERARRIGIK